MKRIIAIFIMAAVLLGCGMTASAANLENVPYDNYSYWQEDAKRFLAGGRSMFDVEDVTTGESLSISSFSEPADITTGPDGKIYLLDSGNSRIVVLTQDMKVDRIIENIGGETFKAASGITTDSVGNIYIADTENKRVLVSDLQGNLIKEITCPDSEIIPDDFEFNPLQLTVDKNGYLYVLSEGSFYGALVFSPEGETEGFFAATKVKATVGGVIDTLWNKWFMTDAQRASQIQKTPYQFSDMCIDETGLLYTTTGAVSSQGSQTGQIRCLGPSGVNVLKSRTGRSSASAEDYNFADEGLASLAVGKRTQNFISIDISNGYIYALDQTYGKVFVYTDNCELLTVFGGGVKKGEQKGTFTNAVAVTVANGRIYVLDSAKGSITQFILNEYGSNVQKAAMLTNSGKYEEARPLWEEIIKLDRNNQLAYRGLARAELYSKNYDAAMKFAKQGVDKGIYDQAFEYVRNEFLEKYLSWIIVIAIVLVVLVVIWIVKKKNKEKEGNENLKIALTCAFHPFDNFRLVKYKGFGSLTIATIFLVLYYVSRVLKDFYSGFAFSTFNVKDYNSLLTLIGTVGVVILWVICNWAVAVLAQGKAKIKEIYIVACYSLVPQIVGSILYLVLSNVLLLKEATILTVITTVCLILTGIILCIGTMIVHDFDFFRFLWTALITLIAMALVIFLCFMIIILLQQFFAFIKTVFIEITYR